ncbi:hypothetical protein [Moritella viscosa]|uniref:AraC-type arabinose-binding/dimerisation domain-containing protein n=1 Tax=Moritella viscosa TaxID=80854 RepID=A0A090I8U1_9GAMM|nr:hypothetical protein [Moritella viscosa]CED58066.1 putative uncharacterized protein [Moritella viscosa]SGY93616.1 Putative uncharacterized protein [Moritella viscosa]SGY98366.1 Putative uncharacterized protein [Moritella viscosa]SGY98762.1 Putative uncharacterized protein [Moritella viscosa]SGZ04755.1 Putative uncharacterized protein [Moritella viscosa]
MSLPIEYVRLNLLVAEKTKRQRQYKAQLLIMRSGDINIRLGKTLITLNQSQSIWLPHDCLYSLESITTSQIDILSFSARVTIGLPTRLYQRTTPSLLPLLIDELTTIDNTSVPAQHLFQVCLDLAHKLTEHD